MNIRQWELRRLMLTVRQTDMMKLIVDFFFRNFAKAPEMCIIATGIWHRSGLTGLTNCGDGRILSFKCIC